MMHAIGRRASFTVHRVALVHHSQEPLGQRFNGLFSPQQRRAAAYTFEYKSRNGRDYSSKNEHALSLQPTATAHMTMSIIAEVSGLHSSNAITDALYAGRFSGGQIVAHRDVALFDSLDEARGSIASGFCVMDRRDLLMSSEKAPHAALIDYLGCDPGKDGQSWMSAACLGYAAVTAFKMRDGARGGYAHAFGEPLIGLVQYRSVRAIDVRSEEILWRPLWLSEDVFVVQQTPNNPSRG
jgi:CRISPR-associated protein Csy2